MTNGISPTLCKAKAEAIVAIYKGAVIGRQQTSSHIPWASMQCHKEGG